MQNGGKALPRISSTGRGQMLITLEPHRTCIFLLTFEYLYILTLSRHWYT